MHADTASPAIATRTARRLVLPRWAGGNRAVRHLFRLRYFSTKEECRTTEDTEFARIGGIAILAWIGPPLGKAL